MEEHQPGCFLRSDFFSSSFRRYLYDPEQVEFMGRLPTVPFAKTKKKTTSVRCPPRGAPNLVLPSPYRQLPEVPAFMILVCFLFVQTQNKLKIKTQQHAHAFLLLFSVIISTPLTEPNRRCQPKVAQRRAR